MSTSDAQANDPSADAAAPGGGEGSPPGNMLAVLGDALCGVDGTTSAYEAVAQAAALVGPHGHLSLLVASAVSGSGSAGSFRVHTLEPSAASLALEHAQRLAARAGVDSDTEIEEYGSPVDVILQHAAKHRLLALGAPPISRFAQMLLGGVASEAVHELPCALLIARRPPEGRRFDERILVASDAGERSDALVAFAAQLALARGASLVLVHAAGPEPSYHPTRITAQTERLRAALGTQPMVHVSVERPNREIVEAADAENATLIVMASRRVGGLRAIGSVSERVAHDAPCSVLILRPEDLPHDDDIDDPLAASAGQR